MNQKKVRSQSEDYIQVYQEPNLRIIIAVTLMAVLGSSSIGPALPTLALALKIPPQHVGLVIVAFVVPIAIGTPISGVLADRFGRKQILIPSLLLFAIAGAACATALDFRTLLEWRFLQGIGAASLESLALTLISDLYTGKALTAAMGFNGSAIGISLAIYPLISGGLATLGWQYPFLMSLTALPIALLVFFSLKIPNLRRQQEFSLQAYWQNIWRSINNRQVFGLWGIQGVFYASACFAIATFALLSQLFAKVPPLGNIRLRQR